MKIDSAAVPLAIESDLLVAAAGWTLAHTSLQSSALTQH
jgi:hypothetical protein